MSFHLVNKLLLKKNKSVFVHEMIRHTPLLPLALLPLLVIVQGNVCAESPELVGVD